MSTGNGTIPVSVADPVETVTFQPPDVTASRTTHFQLIAMTFEPVARLLQSFDIRTAVYCIAQT